MPDKNAPNPSEGVFVHPATLRYAATALEGSADNGDRYAAAQIREALGEPARSDYEMPGRDVPMGLLPEAYALYKKGLVTLDAARSLRYVSRDELNHMTDLQFANTFMLDQSGNATNSRNPDAVFLTASPEKTQKVSEQPSHLPERAHQYGSLAHKAMQEADDFRATLTSEGRTRRMIQAGVYAQLAVAAALLEGQQS